MSKPSAFTEQERADLVAYLDGELEGDAARAIEQKLALNPAARAEADALKRTWDLLDFLPKTEPSPNFTHRTLDRLGPIRTGTQPAPGGRRGWRLALFGTGWAAALALAALGGYSGFNALAPPHKRPDPPPVSQPGDADLARDLNVIKNKRVFELVEDIDFVRELDSPDLFGADSPGS
jgi:anti-sigma factor RsiW